MKDQQLWLQLLQLSSQVRAYSEVLSYVYCSAGKILFNALPDEIDPSGFFVKLDAVQQLPDQIPCFTLNGLLEVKSTSTASFQPSKIDFIKLYLPYCFLSMHAHRMKRCISVTHFAQTLDGKIATEEGDARWIGNEENLDHAHRMRALCESIMVGNNTIRNDQPSLTVRRVSGNNPKRIVIGTKEVDLTSLMNCCPDPILVVSNTANYPSSQIEHLRVPSDNCRMNSEDVLRLLFERGIQSVYIEGGAVTTSNFLDDQAVDIFQLHIAPLIFGSGKQGVVLPAIAEVSESQSFQYFEFHKIGDAMMFVGSM